MPFRLALIFVLALGLFGCESPEEKEAKRVEQEALQKIQEEEKKQAFIDGLATSDNSSYLDFSSVTERALAGETEIQEEIHQSELINRNWELSGEVYEIETFPVFEDKHGFKRVLIQLVDYDLASFGGLIASAECFVSESGFSALTKVGKGDSLTIYGEVWRYGDQLGLQLRKCTIPADKLLAGEEERLVRQRWEQQFSPITMEQAMSRGEYIYQAACSACHGGNGEGGLGSALQGSTIVMNNQRRHAEIIVKGVIGTAMLAHDFLPASDIASVMTYSANAFGNESGILVQPADLKSLIED